jgi:citrate lyase beta subunit
MRHFDFVSAQERDRLFLHVPEPFGVDEDATTLGVALGATLYCPASRPNLAADIVRRAAHGVVSTVVCLEDSIPDDDLRAAERNVVDQLRSLADSTEPVPMVFVRVRSADQIAQLVRDLGADARMLAGFVLPKFGEDSGAEYLDAVVAAGEAVGRRLLAMPVLESAEIAYLDTRASSLDGTRQLLEKYRDLVPAVRIGATDLSGAYGLRRPRDFTIWEIRVVADVISTIVNIFGRADAGAFVVAGPVWEYFTTTERMFKPQLRESPFVGPAERALRTKLVAADLDGLIREVALDRANGLTGKTVIHPSHVAAVHALSVVGHEEFADAGDILATNRSGGAAASSYGNKMNESKPHTAWARRTLLRARMFGVAREQVSFADLLGASLYQ